MATLTDVMYHSIGEGILEIRHGMDAVSTKQVTCWLCFVLVWAALSACSVGRAEGLPYVDLSAREPLPAAAAANVAPLRVAVAAVVSPQGTVESYQPLLDYLARRLGRPVQLIQRRTYAEVNDLIAADEVDVAFVCTSAYVIGQREFGMQLLVVPRVEGETVYHSWLIVPSDSPAQSMRDLEGGVFAFTDPWSTSGRVVPTAQVRALGRTPEDFFKRVIYTYSHDAAIRAVADRVVDGAAVDSLVYRFAVARDPDLAERTRVIYRSPPFAAPPVVTSPHIRAQLRAQLADILTGMADDPEAQAALGALDVEAFVPIEDAAYDSVRQLQREAGLWDLP